MQLEDHLLDKIGQIFIVDSPDIADPPVRVGLPLLAEGKGEGAVDVGEDDLFIFVLTVFFLLHHCREYDDDKNYKQSCIKT